MLFKMKDESSAEVKAINIIDGFSPDFFSEEVSKFIRFFPAIPAPDFVVPNDNGSYNLKEVPDDLSRYIKGLLKDESLGDTIKAAREKSGIQILDFSNSEFKNSYSLDSAFEDIEALYHEDVKKFINFRTLLFGVLDSIMESEGLERVGIPVVLSRLLYEKNDYNEKILSACVAYYPANSMADMFWCDNSESVLIRVNKGINQKSFKEVWNSLESITNGKFKSYNGFYVARRMSHLKNNKKYSLEKILKTYHPEYLIEDKYGINRLKEGKNAIKEQISYFDKHYGNKY